MSLWRNKMPLRDAKHIFIACMPKSGSTFLCSVLTEITGFNEVNFRHKPIDNIQEQDISRSEIEKYKSTNTITQQHTRGAIGNFNLLQEFNCYTLVLVRNINDIVISSFDHSEKSGKTGSSMVYNNEEYFKLPDNLKEEMIVELGIPWYIHFYTSWYDRITNTPSKKIRWIIYEDFVSDPIGYLEELLRYCEVTTTREAIQAAYSKILLDEKRSRLNKGVAGRGQNIRKELKYKIISYTRFYPWVDFSLIGINNK